MMRAPGFSCVAHGLEQRQRRDHIGPVDLLQHVERVIQQARLRAGAEDAGVVDHARPGRRSARRAAASARRCAGSVTSPVSGDHFGQLGEFRARCFQRLGCRAHR